VLHGLVADKIAAALRPRSQPAAAPPPRGRRGALPPPAYVVPLAMRYVVPPGVPIVLWDSAIRVTLGEGETIEAFAARVGAPAWAIASINNIGEEPPAAGSLLLVPRSIQDAER
jgi:hypothetical protein